MLRRLNDTARRSNGNNNNSNSNDSNVNGVLIVRHFQALFAHPQRANQTPPLGGPNTWDIAKAVASRPR